MDNQYAKMCKISIKQVQNVQLFASELKRDDFSVFFSLFLTVQGGGFFISGGNTTLTSCTISGNTAVSIVNSRDDDISRTR